MIKSIDIFIVKTIENDMFHYALVDNSDEGELLEYNLKDNEPTTIQFKEIQNIKNFNITLCTYNYPTNEFEYI